LLIPLIEGHSAGWPVWSFLSLVFAVFFLALFYLHQQGRRRAGHFPLVDMQLLAQRRFSLGALLVFLIYSTSSSFFLCFALLMQSGLGLDPFLAGSLFAPCCTGFVAASLLAPKLVARWGSSAIAAGAIFYALSMGLLIVQVGAAGAGLNPVHLIPALILTGAGQGMIMTPLLNLVLGFVEARQAGMASGLISTLQQIGAAMGVAVTGILFSSALSDGGQSGERAALYTSAFASGMLYNLGAAALSCVLLILLVRSQPPAATVN